MAENRNRNLCRLDSGQKKRHNHTVNVMRKDVFLMYALCFALVLVMPLMMLAVGARWLIKPPAFKTGTVVYRTALTEKSPAVWSFAHEYCGKLWSRYGAIMVVIASVLMYFLKNSYQKFILWILVGEMLMMCITIFMMDIFIKNLFDENGDPVPHLKTKQ